MNENTIIKSLEQINMTLSNGVNQSSLLENVFIPIITTVFSVVVGALLGTWLTSRSERKRIILENHKKFFEDFNEYFIKIHSLFQEIYNYNDLIKHLGFSNLIYDFSKTHNQNIPNFLQAELEYNNYKKSKKKFPNKTQYWELINGTIQKLKNYNLIIDLASSMNSNAQVSSMFVSKKVKLAFDSLILETQEMSKNNFSTFYIYQYRLDVLAVLQLIKNEIDPNKEPLFYEHQELELKNNNNVKITVFANSFTVKKIKGNKVTLINSKGKKYIFNQSEVEPL